MKKGESIDDMFSRMQVLLIGFEAQGHTLTKAQKTSRS